MRIVSVVAVVVVLVVFVVPMGQLGYDWLTACRGEERAVFEEFPQYAPRTPEELDPRPDLNALTAVGGDCFVEYRTPDGEQEVREYFEERLEENGWEQTPGTPDPLTVRRGNYEYRVSFPGDPASSMRTQEGTRVAVLVEEV